MIRIGYLGDIQDSDFDITENDYGFYCTDATITNVTIKYTDQ